LFAERFWKGEPAVGRRVQLGRQGEDSAWHSVVGVVPNVVQDEVDEPLRPTVYSPLAQAAPRFASLAVRTTADPLLLAEPVRQVLRELDPDLPVYWLRSLEEWIDLGRFGTRFIAALFVIFGAVALVLGGVGLYAVLAQTVGERTREIGVRRALGALDPQVVRLLLREGAQELGLGLALGLVVSAGFARFLSGELIGVDAFDPLTFGTVALVLGLAGLLAAVIPAHRAVSVDPLVALRAE
jgi:predicted lysophospholipase L1 biosynthesis ABC-type transport system permease subunit